MPGPVITVTTRVLGRRKKLLNDWSVDLPPEFGGGSAGPITLRELITRIVLDTVEQFRRRQEQNRFINALTVKQIADQAVAGKVISGGSDLNQKVDKDEAVANALVSFEDGLYLVIIDDVEQRDLDATIYLQPDSRVTFLRLVMLAGA